MTSVVTTQTAPANPLLLLPPYVPVKSLPVAPPKDISAEEINARAETITTLLRETLSRVDSYRHGGLNE